MKRFIKYLIILLIIIIIIICIVLGILRKKQKALEIVEEPDDPSLYLEIDNTVQLVTIRNNFYAAKSCIDKFFSYYMQYNTSNSRYIIDEEAEDSNKQVIYSMLDNEYIQYKGITQDNILDKLDEIPYSTIEINKMYVQEENENINLYIAYGVINDKINVKQTDFTIAVKIDMKNKTFKILLQDYIEEKYQNISIGETLDIPDEQTIQNDGSNIFEFEIISDEEYIVDVFNKFRENLIYQQKLVYDTLNEEYKEKRFGNYENFQTYLQENAVENIMMELDQYQKIVHDEYNEYVCIDNNGNYYVFNEKSVMNYEIIMDTYTIDLPEFVEKYNSANSQVKVGMNIEKILEAINRKDYQYVYNKLDDTFKSNNYPSLKDFEEEIKEKLFEKNDLEYSNFTQEGNTYIYELKVKNLNNTEDKEKDLTVIMSLKENTDFVMSFNIE